MEEVFHECVHLDELREWLTTGAGSLHESSKLLRKKINALEFIGVQGNAFVFVERSKDRLIKFMVVNPIVIMEALHSL